LGELHERAGDLRQALNCYRRGVLLVPRKEALYQRLMHLLGKQGDRAEVASVYALCRKTFEQDFGSSPSRKTTELYRTLMADRERAG
jgi:DNA-binding SARP family transcriptional activator